MSAQTVQLPPTLREIVQGWDGADREALIERLTAREDHLADLLRQAGAQLGAMPEFVTKVLMDIGIGSEVDDTTKGYIDQQFANALAWLQEEYRRQRGDQ